MAGLMRGVTHDKTVDIVGPYGTKVGRGDCVFHLFFLFNHIMYSKRGVSCLGVKVNNVRIYTNLISSNHNKDLIISIRNYINFKYHK